MQEMDTENGYKFYDFDKNWDAFYKVWTSDPVQDVLERHMNSWCLHEAYYDQNMQKPKWKRCDDLWTYSRTDFHCSRIMERVQEKIQKERCVQKYRDAQARFGIKFSSEERLLEAFSYQVYPHVYDMCRPAPGSLEANVLFLGANYLTDALLEAAKIMFPGKMVDCFDDCEGSEMITVDLCLIFDFVRFFFRDHTGVGELTEQFWIGNWPCDESDDSIFQSDSSSDDGSDSS